MGRRGGEPAGYRAAARDRETFADRVLLLHRIDPPREID
jgi:hypothetical protein